MERIIVNETCSNIRLLSRRYLKGLWKPAIIAVLVYSLCTIIPTLILQLGFNGLIWSSYDEMSAITTGDIMSALFTTLVTGAFAFGVTVYFLNLVRNKKPVIADIFSGFNYYLKTLGLMIVMNIFIALWSLLLIVPGIIASLRYSQAFYILADDPSKGIMQCIRESKEMMKGNKMKLFLLELSFIGWYALIYAVVLAVSIVGGIITVFVSDMLFGVFFAILMVIVVIISSGMAICLLTYVMTATTVFYEMVTGHLRAAPPVMPQYQQTVYATPVAPEVPAEPVVQPEASAADEIINVKEDGTENEKDC